MTGYGGGVPVTPVFEDSIPLSYWWDEVVPVAKMCPNRIINRELLNTIRDFCRRTMLLVKQCDSIDVVADQAEYKFRVRGYEALGADRAEYNGEKLTPTSETALDEDEREPEQWRTQTVDIRAAN